MQYIVSPNFILNWSGWKLPLSWSCNWHEQNTGLDYPLGGKRKKKKEMLISIQDSNHLRK